MKNSHYYLCMLHVWCKFWMLDNLWIFKKSQITVNVFQVGPLKWQKLPNWVLCVSHQVIFSCQGVVIKRCTLLCTGYQSCLWDFHINLSEKNVNRYEPFWVEICLKNFVCKIQNPGQITRPSINLKVVLKSKSDIYLEYLSCL